MYACEGFFERCNGTKWPYIPRYKEGSIPAIGAERRELKKWEKNHQEQIWETGKKWHDYITDIDYKGYQINLAERGIVSGAAKHKAVLRRKGNGHG
ncbi:MAG: hypothetical protein HFH49_10090 [Lachnospiraceae bacterium]|nr:hypothetical protein [Lachnospiraceae bacterium]